MNYPVSIPHGKDKRKIVHDFLINTTIGSAIVPAGFVWNGANIPRVFWIYSTPFSPEYEVAVLLHDFFCGGGDLCDGYKPTRREIDRMFFDLMLRYGVRRSRALLMYAAVRVWSVFSSDYQKAVNTFD